MAKNGIIQENEGFFVLVNGVQRTFRDEKSHAYDAARLLKQKHKTDIVEIEDRSTGAKVMMMEDGRTA